MHNDAAAESPMSDQHSSPIKTPQQLITVVVLAFVVPVLIIVLLVKYVASAKMEGAGTAAMTPEAIAERLRPVGTVVLAEAGGARTLQSGEAVYQLACAACHAAGVAGAPKTGDAGQWSARLAQGYDTLVKHAVEGFKGMPAKGGNADLDPIEVARAVVYMANRSGGKFKEPEAAPPPAVPAANAAERSGAQVAAAATAPAAAKVDAAAGKQLYDTACMACHATGVAGAPRFGDKAAWAPRIQTGIDALTAAVVKGKGAMPPRGAAATATDAQLRAAVEYMVAAAK
jgi:cytochrome c5